MTAHNAARNDARSRARERMLELNRARAERDVRIEQAVTAALVTLDQRRAAQQAVHAATDELVTALRQLVGEQVSVEGAATLTGIAAHRATSTTAAATRVQTVAARNACGHQTSSAGAGTGTCRPQADRPGQPAGDRDRGSVELVDPASVRQASVAAARGAQQKRRQHVRCRSRHPAEGM